MTLKTRPPGSFGRATFSPEEKLQQQQQQSGATLSPTEEDLRPTASDLRYGYGYWFLFVSVGGILGFMKYIFRKTSGGSSRGSSTGSRGTGSSGSSTGSRGTGSSSSTSSQTGATTAQVPKEVDMETGPMTVSYFDQMMEELDATTPKTTLQIDDALEPGSRNDRFPDTFQLDNVPEPTKRF